MSTDPFPRGRKFWLPRLSVEAWVVLALIAGSAPWAAMAAILLWP